MVDSREITESSANQSGILVNVFGRTDVGMVRDHNEDNFLIVDLSMGNRSIQPEVQNHQVGPLGSLFAVCDGMGGAAAGEVASQIAVDTIYEMMQIDQPPADDVALARRLNGAVCEAGRRIHLAARENAARRGMGTTSTVATLVGERLIFGQVGDSRAYIFRNGKLVQTTKDQSLVQQLIDAGQLTEEEARNFDRSNIILQALGTSDEVHVDITSTVLRQGDVLVMCSDGLSGLVKPDEIEQVVASMESPMAACKQLTQMACDAGGDDNVTVIVAVFDGPGLLPPDDGATVSYQKFFDPLTDTLVDDSAIASADKDGEGRTDSVLPPDPLPVEPRVNHTVTAVVLVLLVGLLFGGVALLWPVVQGGENDLVSGEAVNVIQNELPPVDSERVDDSMAGSVSDNAASQAAALVPLHAAEQNVATDGALSHADSDTVRDAVDSTTGGWLGSDDGADLGTDGRQGLDTATSVGGGKWQRDKSLRKRRGVTDQVDTGRDLRSGPPVVPDSAPLEANPYQ